MRPISPPMKTSMPPRLPTNKPSIRRMRLHAGLTTSLDPTSANIPTRTPTTIPVKLPNRAKLVPKSIGALTSTACSIPPTKRTMPPIRTRNFASVSNGTCDAIFQLLRQWRSGYLVQEFEHESAVLHDSPYRAFIRFSSLGISVESKSNFLASENLTEYITLVF